MMSTPGAEGTHFDLDLAVVDLPAHEHLAQLVARIDIARLHGLIGREAHACAARGSSASSTRSTAASRAPSRTRASS